MDSATPRQNTDPRARATEHPHPQGLKPRHGVEHPTVEEVRPIPMYGRAPTLSSRTCIFCKYCSSFLPIWATFGIVVRRVVQTLHKWFNRSAQQRVTRPGVVSLPGVDALHTSGRVRSGRIEKASSISGPAGTSSATLASSQPAGSGPSWRWRGSLRQLPPAYRGNLWGPVPRQRIHEQRDGTYLWWAELGCTRVSIAGTLAALVTAGHGRGSW
jgi:hypothetical protein